MRNLTRALVSTLLLVAACRSSGGSGDDSNVSPDANNNVTPDSAVAQVTSVSTIRQNQPVTGAAVSLRGVVVTARVTSSKSGKLWVQDAGGGMYSGIEVFCSFTSTSHPCTMTRNQIDAIAVGQTVDIDGSFDVFTPTMPAGAQPTLEVSQPTITNSGGIVTPVALDVDAATIASDQYMAAGVAPYEGAYVHVTGPAMVTNATAPEFTGACTSSTGVAGTTYYGFEATAGSAVLDVGLNFYSTLTYCIPQCGYPCTNEVTNQTFTDISGIVEADSNSTNNDVYLKISPVEDTDLPVQ